MNKKAIIFALAFFSLFAFASLSSAYYYPPQGQYDSYSLYSARTSGYYGGPVQLSTRDYNRYTAEEILPDGSMQTTTHFMTTKRESPRQYAYYGNYNYPQYNYGNYNRGYSPSSYGNYYTNYNYDDYYPWYQKYWESNSYPRANYYPRHYF